LLKRLGCSYIDVRFTRNRAQNIGVPNGQIANVKDGVLVEGAGSDSIDQQRDNGQFGGDAFWEIKNGKKTRMASVARIVPVPDSQDHGRRGLRVYPGTALVPAMKIEDFRRTSLSRRLSKNALQHLI